MSHTRKGIKTVKFVISRVSMLRPAMKQKLDSPGKEVVQPKKKAKAFVSEVSVMEAPACIKA